MNSFIKTTRKCRKGFHHNKTLKLNRDSHRLEKIIKSPAFKKKVKDLIEKPVPKEAFKKYFNEEMAGGDSVSSTEEKHILSKIRDNLYDILNAIKIRLLTGVPSNVPQELADEIISSPTKSLSIKSPASIKSMTIKSMSPNNSLPKSVKSSLSKSINSIKSHLTEDVKEEYEETLDTDEIKNKHSLYNSLITISNVIIFISIVTSIFSTFFPKIKSDNIFIEIILNLKTTFESINRIIKDVYLKYMIDKNNALMKKLEKLLLKQKLEKEKNNLLVTDNVTDNN